MKKLITLFLAVALCTSMSAFAADYGFGSRPDTFFGNPTSYDEPITLDPLTDNIRRNKDAADYPPPYGIFSGDIPTDPSSPYHNNLPGGGFVPADQELPPTGGEDYAPGSSDVDTELLPPTSETVNANTLPWAYEDGSIGTLYIPSVNKTITVYEGETAESMKKGAGHFTATSAWDGNIALAGHNRGSAPYFSFVKDLKNGDTLTYTTRYGTRTYTVISKTQVNELDSSSLSWSAENILTLITCVADVPEMRYCVVAKET
ncbi:MAG: sortase [Oscillospiraceae bacterium]|jgi:sortase A|nr:sortase [Oscillospiraceae bacterium]